MLRALHLWFWQIYYFALLMLISEKENGYENNRYRRKISPHLAGFGEAAQLLMIIVFCSLAT
jgi:hypothetical protein